ncbi:hypothetical protein [Aporhodopirellula aestuarii]|uniref:Uncharacterized protein n=1 Tax=Aporhodopirellula aestuarii TaxID=2950107 RepID=A0ABT0TXB8_9BACT|nr:hypothetical protein [Aporhodopirellula aestuarii]MCM2369247.1 hypothetical protein [Aporhodopirellula aestuarii]
MNQTNPEIESALDELAALVCQALKNEGNDLAERYEGLLKTLLMSGYSTKPGAGLMADVEARVKSQCGECAMHRGGALSSITSDLGVKFKSLSRWESRVPSDDTPAKPANISAVTDS